MLQVKTEVKMFDQIVALHVDKVDSEKEHWPRINKQESESVAVW